MVLYALACTLQMSVSVESSPLLLFSSLLGLVCPCRAIALCSVRNPIPPEAVTTTPSAFKLRNCTCWLRVDSSTDDFSWENPGQGAPFCLSKLLQFPCLALYSCSCLCLWRWAFKTHNLTLSFSTKFKSRPLLCERRGTFLGRNSSLWGC